jgi:UDP-glucose 4-epimerase
VASSEKIGRELCWEPGKDLETMIEDAWSWHQAHPAGYADLEGGSTPSK